MCVNINNDNRRFLGRFVAFRLDRMVHMLRG